LIPVIRNLIKKIVHLGLKSKPLPPSDPSGPQPAADAIHSPEIESHRPRSPEKPKQRGDKDTAHRRPERRQPRPASISETVSHPPPAQGDTAWDIASFKVEPKEGLIRFHDLNLPEPLMHAIADLGYQYCTPVQAEVLPSTLNGRDAYGRAQTGTGKTAAFLITILTRLHGQPLSGKPEKGTPRVLVLAPTRELVIQIAEEGRALAKYMAATIVSVFGGMDYEKQRRQLTDQTVDMVVATPGRLLDFQRHRDLRLDRTEILVIDEADRMLDMGFIPDVRKIVLSTPHKSKRQTMLFSATLTEAVTRLSDQWTKDPISVAIEPEKVAVDTVDQQIYIVTAEQKFALIYNIIARQELDRILIFCNRRDETRRLADLFDKYRIDCAVLSGEVPQKKRLRTLEDFKAGKIRALVATDVAGRGIHIEGMSHVLNFTLPQDPEDYVHRIGRTGRAGASGTSVSFACEEDSFFIPRIESLIGRELPCMQPPDEWLVLPPAPKSKRKPRKRRTDDSRPPRSSRTGETKGRSLRRRRHRPATGGLPDK